MESLKLSNSMMDALQRIMVALANRHPLVELQQANIIASSNEGCRGCGGGCSDSCRGTCGYACSNSFLP